MKNTKNILTLIALATLFASCTKVIELPINPAGKKYVIEGVVTNNPDSNKVVISETVDFGEDFASPVSGARVAISASEGQEYTLHEVSPGLYKPAAFTGEPGKTYHLKVNINGREFTGTSTMPAVVPFDSLSVSEEEVPFDGRKKIAIVRYTDPVGRGNSYKFTQYVNGIRARTYYIENDNLNDGKVINLQMMMISDPDDTEEERQKKQLKPGDLLRVDMLCIDQAVHRYWYSLQGSALGSNQRATPTNPVSNLSGDALGYFSAHTFASKSLRVE